MGLICQTGIANGPRHSKAPGRTIILDERPSRGHQPPMSASAIITARWAGVSPWIVGSRWSAVYTMAALLMAWAAILALSVA